MVMSARSSGLKRFLSELSSVLVDEHSEESLTQAKSSFDTEVKGFDFSQEALQKLQEPRKNKSRRLRIKDDLVIIPDELPLDVENGKLPFPNIDNDQIEVEDFAALFVSDDSQSIDEIEEEKSSFYRKESYGNEDDVVEEGVHEDAKFSSKQLKNLVATFLQSESKKFTLPSTSTDELVIVVDGLVELLTSQLNELIKSGQTSTLDKPTLLRIFARYGVVKPSCNNNDLFNICKKYLNLEDLNELEISLFSSR